MGDQTALGGDGVAVAVPQWKVSVAQLEHGDIGVGAGTERADGALVTEYLRRCSSGAYDDIVVTISPLIGISSAKICHQREFDEAEAGPLGYIEGSAIGASWTMRVQTYRGWQKTRRRIYKGAGRAEIPQVRYGRRSLSAIDDHEDVNGAVIGIVEKAGAITQRVVYRHDNGAKYN